MKKLSHAIRSVLLKLQARFANQRSDKEEQVLDTTTQGSLPSEATGSDQSSPTATEEAEVKDDEKQQTLLSLLPKPPKASTYLTTIHEGMISSSTPALEAWLKLQPSEEDKRWLQDNKALHAAIRMKNLFMVKYLAELGLEINTFDTKGLAPIHLAIEAKSLGMVRILMACGANKNLPTDKGILPSELAQRVNRTANHYEKAKMEEIISLVTTIKTLEKGLAMLEQATNAINQHDLHGLESALDKASDYLQDKDLAFNKLMHEAVLAGFDDAIQAISKGGLPLNEVDDDGNAPIHLAVKLGHKSAIQKLASLGADINQFGQYGFTPLHLAAKQLDGDIIATLLALGANQSIEVYGIASAGSANTPANLALQQAEFEAAPTANQRLAIEQLGESWPTRQEIHHE